MTTLTVAPAGMVTLPETVAPVRLKLAVLAPPLHAARDLGGAGREVGRQAVCEVARQGARAGVAHRDGEARRRARGDAGAGYALAMLAPTWVVITPVARARDGVPPALGVSVAVLVQAPRPWPSLQ